MFVIWAQTAYGILRSLGSAIVLKLTIRFSVADRSVSEKLLRVIVRVIVETVPASTLLVVS